MKRHAGKWRGLLLAGTAVACLLYGAMVPAPGVEAGVVGSPHDFSTTGPWTQSSAVAPSGTCSACHVPHGADSFGLWLRNLTLYRTKLGMNGSISSEPNYVHNPTIPCYDCHDSHDDTSNRIDAVPDKNDFGSSHKPQNIAFGFTKTGVGSMTEDSPGGTVAGYYENKPPYQGNPSTNYGADPNLNPSDNAQLLKTGGHYFKYTDPDGSATAFKIGDKLPCRDCHDPHKWDANWQAFMRNSWPTGVVQGRLSSPVAASSFMANAPVSGSRDTLNGGRKLCTACHGTSDGQGPVLFTDISTAYSSSSSIVRPPASISEHSNSDTSTPCVSCHPHNSVDVSCGECHGSPPPGYPTSTTNKNPEATPAGNYAYPGGGAGREQTHAKHVGHVSGTADRFSQYSIECKICHAYSATGLKTPTSHGNDNVEIDFDFRAYPEAWSRIEPPTRYRAFTGATYNRTTCGTGTGGLGGVWCHSAGHDNTAASGYYKNITWGTAPLKCSGCHGNAAYDNANIRYGMPDASDHPNSHPAHVVASGIECSVCHFSTATGTYTNQSRAIRGTTTATHVNGTADVDFDPAVATGSYTAATRTCSVSCHGTANQPQWGTVLGNGCFACHQGTEGANKPQDNVGIPNPLDYTQYIQSGHGRSTTYPVTNNPGAGKWDNASGQYRGCYSSDTPTGCHDAATPHFSGIDRVNNPFRITNNGDTTALCLACHGPSGPAQTRDMQQHAKSITAPTSTKTWPNNYDWKCVDCHDPHGDGTDAARRIAMIRSAINNPTTGTDNANVGSDAKGRPLRNPAWTGIVFTDNSGFSGNGTTTGGHAIPGVGNWGICEGCHRQTSAFSQTLDNASTHATRTSACTSCHPHSAAFAAKACKGCHGPDGVAAAQGAPNVGTYWTGSGHGMTAAKNINLQCEACHDTGFITATAHRTDGSAGAGPPPANINTLRWPGKNEDANNQRNQNTAHLKSDYFPAGYPGSNPANKYNFALAFDQKCGGPATGCHPSAAHNHHPAVPAVPQPVDRVLRFPDGGTVSNPKAYYWYPAYSDYGSSFYQSRSPWDINDITTGAAGTYPDNAVRYGVCVSCHDPHGTGAPANLGYTTNKMLRGDTLNAGQFCNAACHTSRPPD